MLIDIFHKYLYDLHHIHVLPNDDLDRHIYHSIHDLKIDNLPNVLYRIEELLHHLDHDHSI